MNSNQIKELTLDEVEKLNPNFDFEGWKLTKGETFKNYKNYCLTMNKEGLLLIIWLNKDGIIIPKSLEYVRLLIKNKKDIKTITTQLKNEMCKPIDKSKEWFQVWDIWDNRVKSIREKEKGLRRFLIKENKLYSENGCSYSRNKIDSFGDELIYAPRK